MAVRTERNTPDRALMPLQVSYLETADDFPEAEAPIIMSTGNPFPIRAPDKSVAY